MIRQKAIRLALFTAYLAAFVVGLVLPVKAPAARATLAARPALHHFAALQRPGHEPTRAG